jgi:multidrug efflux pump subunit AcrA (membrane-fusion protein)
VVAIPETLVGRAKDGSATVTLWSESSRKYAAKLREIAPAADPATRTYLAKFSLPEADDEVSLGMTATLTPSDPATQRVARLPSGWCRRCRSEVENRILSLRGATHEAIQ